MPTTRDLDWQVAGIGDLNGDGKDDVLLRHTDGRWAMDGRCRPARPGRSDPQPGLAAT